MTSLIQRLLGQIRHLRIHSLIHFISFVIPTISTFETQVSEVKNIFLFACALHKRFQVAFITIAIIVRSVFNKLQLISTIVAGVSQTFSQWIADHPPRLSNWHQQKLMLTVRMANCAARTTTTTMMMTIGMCAFHSRNAFLYILPRKQFIHFIFNIA